MNKTGISATKHFTPWVVTSAFRVLFGLQMDIKNYNRSISILWAEHRKFYMFLPVVFLGWFGWSFFFTFSVILSGFFLFCLWILSLSCSVRGLGFSLMIYSCSVWEGRGMQTKYTKYLFFSNKMPRSVTALLQYQYSHHRPHAYIHDMRPPRGRSTMSRGERKWILIKHVTNCEQPTGNI